MPTQAVLTGYQQLGLLEFDCYVKYGNRWSYKGSRYTRDGRSAAIQTSYIWDRKVIGVRPAGSNVSLNVHRFKYVPSLAAG